MGSKSRESGAGEAALLAPAEFFNHQRDRLDPGADRLRVPLAIAVLPQKQKTRDRLACNPQLSESPDHLIDETDR